MRNLSRQEQLGRLRERYANRGKEGKSRLLDEMCEEQGYSRKHAIKLLRDGLPKPRGRRRGRESAYEPIRDVVQRIWLAAEQLCGKRLVAALPLWLPYYRQHFGRLLPSQMRLLSAMSSSTADRLLKVFRAQQCRGRSGTKPGTLLRRQIPIQGEVWDEKRPGFMEADSVAHCGESLAGSFIWSLVYTDMATTWTEGRAVWNKGWEGVLEQTKDVERSLPFPLLGFDFDNGGEWLNWHLIHFLQQRQKPVRVTRSRPYHKDDNAHVEQKNWMWPRQLLGYGRLEDPQVLSPINTLYKDLWGPLQNAFLPSMKLLEKRRDGSRWVRRHDRPESAFQRALKSDHLSGKQKRSLRDWHQSLDPFELAEQLEKKLKTILPPRTAERAALGAPPAPSASPHHKTENNKRHGVI